MRDIDRDIAACEVALTALGSGTYVLDADRECLSRKLPNCLNCATIANAMAVE